MEIAAPEGQFRNISGAQQKRLYSWPLALGYSAASPQQMDVEFIPQRSIVSFHNPTGRFRAPIQYIESGDTTSAAFAQFWLMVS